MGYYRQHLFFCCNHREAGEDCCGNRGAVELHAYAKDRLKALGLAGVGRVRANRAGCLGRCDAGPVLVIYPEAVWYTYATREDIDEILDEHVTHGRIVERLRLHP